MDHQPALKPGGCSTPGGLQGRARGNQALTKNVSWAGEVLRIILRLAGPLLLGLALLSVRNRVKR